MERRGMFGRMWASICRMFGVEVDEARDKRVRDAEAIYHQAICQRTQQHAKLKEAVGRLIFLRNRIDDEIQQRGEDIQLVDQRLVRAADRDDDVHAMALIRTKRALSEEIERLRGEYRRLSEQADGAKDGLREVRAALSKLKQERDEMLARKAHAIARIEVAEILERTLGGFSATDQALENVRNAIGRLEYEADLGRDGELEGFPEISMLELRREAEEDEDRMELLALKNRLGKRDIDESFTQKPRLAITSEVAS